MSQFTRSNGDLYPLNNFDATSYTNPGVNAFATAVTVQPQGPVLQFGTFTSTVGHLTGAQVTNAIIAIEQLATVMLYEVTTGGTYDTIAFATYPAGAWDWTDASSAANSADVAITAVCGAGTCAATATFTN